MSLVINDEAISRALVEQRRGSGLDQYDEVWEGVYVMSPMANNEHQDLVTEIAAVIKTVVDWKGLGRTLAGANVSDRRDDWKENYRVPDVLVFSENSSAIDCVTHWFGGPDLAIEIVSPGERVLEKLAFFAQVGTKELIVIDRNPWQLTLYQRKSNGKLVPVNVCSHASRSVLLSDVVPIRFDIDFDQQWLRMIDGDNNVVRAIKIKFA